MPYKGKRRPPWTEQPVEGPRCETHSSANRRFQHIPRPSISTHRARSLASGQLGCNARRHARSPVVLLGPALAVHHALYLFQRCVFLFGSCLVARRPSPALASEPNLAGQRRTQWQAATLTPSRTDRRRVDRSLMDYGFAAGAFAASLPACQPGSGTPKLPPKLAEFNSKARFPLGGGHNTHAALSPFSCSDNRE
jgi:hypothetical protein